MMEHSLAFQSNENFSDKPYKALQALRSAQIGVRLPNKIFIHAVDQFLKHLRNETNKDYANGNDSSKDTIDNNDKILIEPLSTTKGTSLERVVEDIFIFFPGISRTGKTLEQIDYTYGRYISISRNGIVSHWSLSLKLIRESKFQSIEQRKQTLPLWITCTCVLPDVNYFAIATTERDLIFYDINAHTYTGSIIINHLSAGLTTIDYRMNIKNSSQSAIFCGDSLGNLFIFQAKDPFRPMFHISDLIHYMNQIQEEIIPFHELLIMNI
ncbi:unnamed protein product [Rotaria sp. Silwood2]|nr:unnamed protein product [Rotaria sp. Silwood2]CAF4201536.1 unnamed protein product [Rotaria sp. Silwood2]CAF4240217.1 unnamed protein product [Rotaria sp. Silwood2]CAF4450552.1 unnamed protein product [Rotaria sp. Silwood2]